MSAEGRKGLLSLGLSFTLALGAVGTAIVSSFLEEGAVLGVLALAACIAFAALISGFVSLRGPRGAGSALAIVVGLLVLGGVGIGFGAVGFSQLLDIAEETNPVTSHAEAVTDEMFRFRLEPPHPSARMYDAIRARSVNNRARAGFWLEDDDLTGLVFVEPLYGRTLPDGIDQEIAATFASETEWQSDPEPVRYLGRSAWRVRHRSVRDGSVWHSESTFFARDDWLFHLYALREEFPSEEQDIWFPQILDGFEELDGAIEYTDTPRRALDAQGAGFLLRDDVFEDGLWGLRVDTGSAYELSWWHRSTDLDNAAIVTLVKRRPDVSVSISPYALGGRDPEEVIARLRERLDTVTQSVALPPIEAQLGGQTLSWEARSWTAGYHQQARSTWWHDDTRVLELVAWSPLRERVDSALPGIDARVRVDVTRRPMPSERRLITEQAWVSGREIRFVDHDVSWRCPTDLWRVLEHRREETEGARQIARIEAPTLGVTGFLVAEQRTEPSGGGHAHDGWLTRLTTEGADGPTVEHDRRASFSAGEVIGLRTDGLVNGGDLLAISTIDDGGARSYTLELTASARDAREHRAAIVAALEGLAHAPIQERGFNEYGVYSDPRLGYAVSGFQASEIDAEWTELEGEVGSLVHFLLPNQDTLAVMATPLSPYETPETHAERLVRRFYPWVHDTGGSWEDGTESLAGYQAHVRELREAFGVSRTLVYRLVHEGVMYVVLAYSVGLERVDELASRFSLR